MGAPARQVEVCIQESPWEGAWSLPVRGLAWGCVCREKGSRGRVSVLCKLWGLWREERERVRKTRKFQVPRSLETLP